MKAAIDFGLVQAKGQRDYQEDCCDLINLRDVPVGGDRIIANSLIILADGMGGAACGDVASQLAVQVFGKTFSQTRDFHSSLEAANSAIAEAVNADPNKQGMGCTLVAVRVNDAACRWLSVGDSIFYRFHDGQIDRLNRDHSMAPQIDEMVRLGDLTPEEGQDHPDRSALLSALTGVEIPLIDAPDSDVVLQHDDLLVVASDGLETLHVDEVKTIIAGHKRKPAKDIASELLRAVIQKADPYQDNVTIAVFRLQGKGKPPEKKYAYLVPILLLVFVLLMALMIIIYRPIELGQWGDFIHNTNQSEVVKS